MLEKTNTNLVLKSQRILSKITYPISRVEIHFQFRQFFLSLVSQFNWFSNVTLLCNILQLIWAIYQNIRSHLKQIGKWKSPPKGIFIEELLNLSRRRPLSYRNQFNDFLCKSMDWFLYDNDLRLERAKAEEMGNAGHINLFTGLITWSIFYEK